MLKIRKNGFYYYDLLDEKEKEKWLHNFEHQFTLISNVENKIELFLNRYFDSCEDFLRSSFRWDNSSEGYSYWMIISNAKK